MKKRQTYPVRGIYAALVLTALATCWCNAQVPGRTASEAYVLLKITAHDADPDAHSNLQAQIYSVTTNLDAIVLAVSNATAKAKAAADLAGDATTKNAQQDVDLAALSDTTASATATANLANTRAQAANVTNAQNTAAIKTLATPAQVTGIVYSNSVSQFVVWTNGMGAATQMAWCASSVWRTNALGGAVASVNGQNGDVWLDAEDVGATPAADFAASNDCIRAQLAGKLDVTSSVRVTVSALPGGGINVLPLATIPDGASQQHVDYRLFLSPEMHVPPMTPEEVVAIADAEGFIRNGREERSTLRELYFSEFNVFRYRLNATGLMFGSGLSEVELGPYGIRIGASGSPPNMRPEHRFLWPDDGTDGTLATQEHVGERIGGLLSRITALESALALISNEQGLMIPQTNPQTNLIMRLAATNNIIKAVEIYTGAGVVDGGGEEP